MNAVATVFAPELPAACRYLPGVKLSLSEPLTPVGNELAVSRACDRVFRNPDLWCKESRDEITVLSWRSHHEAITRQLRHQVHSRLELAQRLLARQHCHQ